MKEFKGKALYQPKGKAKEYSPWAVNFYTGCSNDCDYCYCKRGVLGHTWSTTPRLKKCFKDEEHALEIFCKELIDNLGPLRDKGLFFSFTTDPLLSKTKALTWAGVALCQSHNVPVKILTKSSLAPDEIPDFPNKKQIAFGFTLTGADDLEPGASTNDERIKAMKILHQKGYKTFASIEPVIDPIRARQIILITSGYCELYKVGLISGKGKNFYYRYQIEIFWRWLKVMAKFGVKIYPKDSLLKYLGIERANLKNFVTADYNFFNNTDKL